MSKVHQNTPFSHRTDMALQIKTLAVAETAHAT